MEFLIALVALTAMEIVLGIDNLVFISIVSNKLPKNQQTLGRRLGLALALITRLGLLSVLSYVVNNLNETAVFHFTDWGISEDLIRRFGGSTGESAAAAERFEEANSVTMRDLILFAGGLFLIWKSVHEIHKEFNENHEVIDDTKGTKRAFVGVLIQIAIFDIVFSIDSVITAVGMVDELWVMVTAICIAVGVMLIFAEPVSRFVDTHPTLKMLALSFMILIGVMLVADSVGAHVDKGHIYFAMAFAVVVEALNLKLRGKKERIPRDLGVGEF